MQIVLGPRQVGKTTLVKQAVESAALPVVTGSADDLALLGSVWLEEHWNRARLLARAHGRAVLVIDEVQKILGWSETVKRLWDADTAARLELIVVLTGSSTLLLRRGMAESLAGRFEVLRATHWLWPETSAAFGCGLSDYVRFGGYPGPMPLVNDTGRWKSYMVESIIESTLSHDVLQLERVDKPVLLRNLFVIACAYSGQIVSLQKLLGQLQDSGNAATIAQYLHFLADAGLVMGLPKYTNTTIRSRASSPKLQVLAPALMTAIRGFDDVQSAASSAAQGRAMESAVGSHLVALCATGQASVSYWREGNAEVDFVISTSESTILLEVKSGNASGAYRGIDAFRRAHSNVNAKALVVGPEGLPFETFFTLGLDDLVNG
jgi:predicted AAA+ superfamily ATPase